MTSAGNAGANGSDGLSYFSGAGMDDQCGLRIVVGSQAWKNNKSFAKSVIILEAEHHRNGQGEPPKVSRRETYPILLNLVQLAAAE